MFRQIVFCVLTYSLLCAFVGKHPYHVSVNTLQYDSKTKSMSVEIKVFYHDLEPAVNHFGSVDIDIKNHSNVKQRDSLVYAYVHDRFKVNTDGNKVNYENKSVSFADEYIFINLLVPRVTGKNITVSNTMCYEIQKTQTNLFHFVVAGKKLTKKTVNPVAETSFSL